MPLDLPDLKPPRKNTQVRLSQEARDTVEQLQQRYPGHNKSDIVEAAILAAGKELNGKGKKR